jgi:hypothetical protein
MRPVHVHGLLPFMVSPLGRVNACTDGTGDMNDFQIEIVPSDGTNRCRYNVWLRPGSNPTKLHHRS